MKITVYKFKSNGRPCPYKNCINNKYVDDNEYSLKPKNIKLKINESETIPGKIYYLKNSKKPDWLDELSFEKKPKFPSLETTSLTALLILTLGNPKQRYAVSLSGNGFNLLNSENLISNYGRQVIDTINKSKYRVINSSNLLDDTRKKISGSTYSLPGYFGLSDNITSFSTRSNAFLNTEMTFSGSIGLSCNLPNGNRLGEFLISLEAMTMEDKKDSIINYPTTDEIINSDKKLNSTFQELREKGKRNTLTNNNLRKISLTNIYELTSIRVHTSKKVKFKTLSKFEFTFTENTLDTFFNKLFRELVDFDGNILDIKVTLTYNNSIREGQLREFIDFNYIQSGVTYFYSSMTWSKISKSYVDIMIDEIEKVQKFSACQLLNLPMRNDEPNKYVVEGYYNYLQGEEEGFYNFDQSNTVTKNPRGYKNIEICDLLYRHKENDKNYKNYFFHIKDKDGGDTTSFTYLMNQIYSSTLFILDAKKPFRTTTFTKLSSGKKYFGENFDFDDYKEACTTKISPLRHLMIEKENMVIVMGFMAYHEVDLSAQSINVLIPLYELIMNLKRLNVKLEYVTLTPN